MFKSILGLIAIVLIGCQASDLLNATTSTGISGLDDKESTAKTVKIGGIDWYVDYDHAMKIAQKKKLPVWLHFGENPG